MYSYVLDYAQFSKSTWIFCRFPMFDSYVLLCSFMYFYTFI